MFQRFWEYLEIITGSEKTKFMVVLYACSLNHLFFAKVNIPADNNFHNVVLAKPLFREDQTGILLRRRVQSTANDDVKFFAII